MSDLKQSGIIALRAELARKQVDFRLKKLGIKHGTNIRFGRLSCVNFIYLQGFLTPFYQSRRTLLRRRFAKIGIRILMIQLKQNAGVAERGKKDVEVCVFGLLRHLRECRQWKTVPRWNIQRVC